MAAAGSSGLLRQCCRRARRRPRSPSPRLGRGTAASGGRRRRAASPGRRPSGGSGGRSYSAHFCQRSGTREKLAHRLAPSSTARSARAIRRGAPSALQPGSAQSSSTMATMLISAPALHRIVHEMRVRARARAAPRARGIPARRRRPAPAPARRCAGGMRRVRCAEPGAQRRPQPVGADQRDAVLVGGGGAVPAGDADAVGVQRRNPRPRVPSRSTMSGLARTASSSAACRSARWIAQ